MIFIFIGVFLLFCCLISASAPPTTDSMYTAESVSESVSESHIINSLLTSFARSVRESIAFGFYRTDLAPSSLGLYEKPQAILSRTDLALG